MGMVARQTIGIQHGLLIHLASLRRFSTADAVAVNHLVLVNHSHVDVFKLIAMPFKLLLRLISGTLRPRVSTPL